MPYSAYTDDHALKSEVYDEAHRRVKGLWTLARREFGIRDSYEFIFSVLTDETMARQTHPHSHVIPRKEQPPIVVMRVSRSEMESPELDANILPREMANVVCKIFPMLGDPYKPNPDGRWLKVYKKLGGKC